MVIRLASGKETTIDYREKAPAGATRDMFLDAQGNAVNERSRSGPLACGVPGSVAGLALAERKYGRLTLAKVMAPAIALAREGFDRQPQPLGLVPARPAAALEVPRVAQGVLQGRRLAVA